MGFIFVDKNMRVLELLTANHICTRLTIMTIYILCMFRVFNAFAIDSDESVV